MDELAERASIVPVAVFWDGGELAAEVRWRPPEEPDWRLLDVPESARLRLTILEHGAERDAALCVVARLLHHNAWAALRRTRARDT